MTKLECKNDEGHSSFDVPDHDFHFNFLKGELIVNHPEQFESSRVGYVIAAEFDARVFLR